MHVSSTDRRGRRGVSQASKSREKSASPPTAGIPSGVNWPIVSISPASFVFIFVADIAFLPVGQAFESDSNVFSIVQSGMQATTYASDSRATCTRRSPQPGKADQLKKKRSLSEFPHGIEVSSLK